MPSTAEPRPRPPAGSPTHRSARGRESGGRSNRDKHLAFAVTAPGLERVTASELEALGIRGPRLGKGGVSFRASTRQLYAANLWLRSATRVVVRIERFRATSFSELESSLRAVPWSTWVPRRAPVRVRVASHGSKLYHTDAIEERVVRVLDRPLHVPARTREGTPGERSTVGTNDSSGAPNDDASDGDDDGQLILVRVNHDEVTISIDSSGAPLSRRGYRLQTAKAPLRENLAAALLLASGWDGTRPLLDPLCGSGTIAIEAALLARNIPPGQHRAFRFGEWPGFEPGTWASVGAEAEAKILDEAPVAIVGTDRDAGAIKAAQANAERADVLGDIDLHEAAISDLTAPAPGPAGDRTGWVITNPPYGARVGGPDLRDLYARFGQVLREQVPGWHLGMLVADHRLAGQTKVRLEEQLRVANGGLRVSYVTGVIPAP
jgi:putative N6-adenine-specific DNA methylase